MHSNYTCCMVIFYLVSRFLSVKNLANIVRMVLRVRVFAVVPRMASSPATTQIQTSSRAVAVRTSGLRWLQER